MRTHYYNTAFPSSTPSLRFTLLRAARLPHATVPCPTPPPIWPLLPPLPPRRRLRRPFVHAAAASPCSTPPPPPLPPSSSRRRPFVHTIASATTCSTPTPLRPPIAPASLCSRPPPRPWSSTASLPWRRLCQQVHRPAYRRQRQGCCGADSANGNTAAAPTLPTDELTRQAVIIGKRPAKGHGREVDQLDIPVIDSPPYDESQTRRSILSIPKATV